MLANSISFSVACGCFTKHYYFRYKKDNYLIFVIQPQKECICDDGFRLAPKWAEMCRFHDVMIDVLSSLEMPHYVIDFLDRQERVKFVLDKIKKANLWIVCDGIIDQYERAVKTGLSQFLIFPKLLFCKK